MVFPFVNSMLGSLGDKQLPVFEVLSVHLGSRLRRGTSWPELTIARSPLHFSGTALVHEVIKADMLEYRSPLLPGIGFVLQSHHIIDWPNPHFSLKTGAGLLLSDMARTSLAGRLGQGIALLLAQDHGFHYYAHLQPYLTSSGICTTDAAGKATQIADFICDRANGGRAVIEAKGSFSPRQNCPTVAKTALKNALDNQVRPWMAQIQPKAEHGYAIIANFREPPTGTKDPSTATFAHIEVEDEHKPIAAISHEEVRRDNYASWLNAMGLVPEAQRLRSHNEERAEPVPFITYQIGEREIAFPTLMLHPFFWETRLPDRRRWGFQSAGIDVKALRAISSAIRGDSEQLMNYAPRERVQVSGDAYSYSIFSDGTFFGGLNARRHAEYIAIDL